MPLTATRSHDVEVGRIRESLVFRPNGLDLFVSGDQLLRGTALNAVLIAEAIIQAPVLQAKQTPGRWGVRMLCPAWWSWDWHGDDYGCSP